MGCLGVFFALSTEEVEHIRSIDSEKDRVEYIREDLEDLYFSEREEYLAECDKAWDAIHRTLTDGDLEWMIGDYPFDHVILGGELLYTESDYIMSLKSPEQVRDIAAALTPVPEEDFRRRYFKIDPKRYGFPVNEEDYEYTWNWFQKVRRIYAKAAIEGLHVLFTADQS